MSCPKQHSPGGGGRYLSPGPQGHLCCMRVKRSHRNKTNSGSPPPPLLSFDSFFISCGTQRVQPWKRGNSLDGQLISPRDHRAGTIQLSQKLISFCPLAWPLCTRGFKLGQALVSSVCVHTQKSEVGTGCLPLSPSTSFFETHWPVSPGICLSLPAQC